MAINTVSIVMDVGNHQKIGWVILSLN